MSAVRQIVVSAMVFALVPPAMLRGASQSVEYLGGTVKSIPVYTSGTLDFDDAKELRFNYGQSAFKIPYEQITGTDIASTGTRHILGKIPVPSLPGHKKETLSIRYKDAAGASGTLNFELSSHLAAEARETIAFKKNPQQETAGAGSQEWWGDRYWKTTRNRAVWDSATQTATAQPAQPGQPAHPAPGGTKE